LDEVTVDNPLDEVAIAIEELQKEQVLMQLSAHAYGT